LTEEDLAAANEPEAEEEEVQEEEPKRQGRIF